MHLISRYYKGNVLLTTSLIELTVTNSLSISSLEVTVNCIKLMGMEIFSKVGVHFSSLLYPRRHRVHVGP